MIHDKELGTITFKRNLRAKRMNVRIVSGGLLVTLPHGLSEKEGMRIVESVRDKLLHRQAQNSVRSIVITEDNPLRTSTFTVHVIKADRKDLFSTLKSGILTIEYPDFLTCEDAKTQEYFWNSINYFLRKEAKRLLPYRTHELAQQHGFQFTDVKIQSSKTRWGSCNRKKNINLTFYLLLLPQHLIDYVILHELCHTVELNHGDRFWALMDKVTDNQSKKLRIELKKQKIAP